MSFSKITVTICNIFVNDEIAVCAGGWYFLFDLSLSSFMTF